MTFRRRRWTIVQDPCPVLARPTPRRQGRSVSILAALCSAAACGGGDAGPTGDVPNDAAASAELEAGPPRRITGMFIPGGSAPEFEACEGEAVFRVVGPALPDLLALQRTLTSGGEPGEPIFVDVLARVEATASGIDSAPDSLLHALGLRRAAFEGLGCRPLDRNLVARGSGTEPFWSVEIYPDRARFRTPEEEEPLRAGSLERSDEGWRVVGTDGEGGRFELRLAPGGCTDSMSGAWSHLTAVFSHGGETWSGCGFLGAAGEL